MIQDKYKFLDTYIHLITLYIPSYIVQRSADIFVTPKYIFLPNCEIELRLNDSQPCN